MALQAIGASLLARQSSFNPFAPPCKTCLDKFELVHVITHECLDSDALRCVIKGVRNDAPLDLEDYVRVGDILKMLRRASLSLSHSLSLS